MNNKLLKLNKSVIITTINSPTKAIKLFSETKNIIIVVADKKTPLDWSCENTHYLSLVKQNQLSFRSAQLIPYNHYARKNIGYLYAIRNKADIIIDTDDDNLPKDDWTFPEFDNNYLNSQDDLGFVNIYKNFTDLHIWPRGFPLNLVNNKESYLTKNTLVKENVKVGIWQGLADGDPDVDAIYRLIINTPCYFNEHEPIVLGKGTICPFNSQNTAFRKELFPLLYLPSYVPFRFTDILRGLIAQPIMWMAKYYLGFMKATVVQERNPHDYMKDFESEIPCYLHPYNIIEIVSESIKPSFSISDNLYQAYNALYYKQIVKQQELELLEAWLTDITN